MDAVGLGLSKTTTTPGIQAKLETTVTFTDTSGTFNNWDATDTVKFSNGKDLDVTFAFDGSDWAVSAGTPPADYTVAFNGSKLSITQNVAADVTDNPFGTITATATGKNANGTLNAAVATGTWTAGKAEATGTAPTTDVTTRATASTAITTVKAAIRTVSDQRAALGAVQNRLEHKISNLDNTVENVSAAESRIRDVDIAKEMTNFTKNNILSQAATAMLAQANAAPQGVLSLLQ